MTNDNEKKSINNEIKIQKNQNKAMVTDNKGQSQSVKSSTKNIATTKKPATSTKTVTKTNINNDVKTHKTTEPNKIGQTSSGEHEVSKIKEEIQKTKNEIELISIFGKLEKNLISVLQTIPKHVDDEGKESSKANIKSYIKKVELARKIFDEYENTAKLITAMTESKEDDQESIEISKKVIETGTKVDGAKINEKDLLKQVQAIEKQTNGLEKVEIETLGDTVIVKKMKPISKEMEYKK